MGILSLCSICCCMLFGVVFGVLGVPNYAALGGITGLLNIIPIVSVAGRCPGAIVGVFVSPWIALFALVATIVIQQVVYTFVSPKIMANSVDVHPALTLIALSGGFRHRRGHERIHGIARGHASFNSRRGRCEVVFVYYFEKRTGRPLVSQDGVFFQGTPALDGKLDPIADATSPHPDVSAASNALSSARPSPPIGSPPQETLSVGRTRRQALRQAKIERQTTL